MAAHEVVDLVYAAGCGVLDGEHAIAAETLVDRAEDALEGLEVADGRPAKEPVCGKLGVGPLHALAGDGGRGGEDGHRVELGLANLPLEL